MLPLFRASKYLLLAYALALAGPWLFFASWDDEASVLVAPFVYAWQAGPVVLAALCVRLSSEAGMAGWFLAVQAAIVLSTAWLWYDLTFVHLDPQNPIALLIFLPLWQYVALAAAWLIALAAGWRPRRDWPEADDGEA